MDPQPFIRYRGKLYYIQGATNKNRRINFCRPISSFCKTICYFIVQHTSWSCLGLDGAALLLIDRQSIDWNEMMIGLSVSGCVVQLQSFSQWYTKARPSIGDDHEEEKTQKTGIRKCYNGSVTFCKSTCYHSSIKEWPDDFNLQFALIWDDGADFLIDFRSRMRIALHGIAM